MHRAARRAAGGVGLAMDRHAAADDRRGALRGDPPRAARGTARQRRHARRGRRLPRRARHPLPAASGVGARAQAARNGCSPPSSPRRRGSTRAARRASSRSGSRRSPASASRATTSSRTGTRKRGEVVASERVHALRPDARARGARCRYGRIDPAAAHEVFIREALVTGDARRRTAPFLAHNRALIEDVAELEHKARRQDVLVDDETLAAFYAERVPADVAFARRRSSAWRARRRGTRPARAALHARGADAPRGRRTSPRRCSRQRSRMAGTSLPLDVSLRTGPSARRR